MRLTRIAFIAAAVVLLATTSGCSVKELFTYVPPEQKRAAAPASPESPLHHTLAYYHSLQTVSVTTARKAAKALKKSRGTVSDIEYAILLMRAKHYKRAQKVLSAAHKQANEKKQTDLANFLLLLTSQVEQTQIAQAQLKRFDRQLSQQNAQLQVMEKQINALKSLEKNFYEREYGVADVGQ
jgi:hypothetical protein